MTAVPTRTASASLPPQEMNRRVEPSSPSHRTRRQDPYHAASARLDEEAYVGFLRHRQETRRADELLDFGDEVLRLVAEQVDRHLAADQVDPGFDAQAAQLADFG